MHLQNKMNYRIRAFICASGLKPNLVVNFYNPCINFNFTFIILESQTNFCSLKKHRTNSSTNKRLLSSDTTVNSVLGANWHISPSLSLSVPCCDKPLSSRHLTRTSTHSVTCNHVLRNCHSGKYCEFYIICFQI